MAQEKRSSFFQGFKVAPLPGSFMITGIFGFLFAAFFLRHYSPTWAVTIGFVSLIIFFASFVSMTKAEVPEELLIGEHLTEHKEEIIYMTKKEYEEHLKQQKAKKTSKSKKKTTRKKATTKKASTAKKTKTASSKRSTANRNQSSATGKRAASRKRGGKK